MKNSSPIWSYLSSILAAAAFVAFVCVFVFEIFAYQRAVVEWANRDLQSRADLAAANLAEPIRTQDFRAIHAFGERCIAEGVRLTITGPSGGRIFDTRRNPSEDSAVYSRQSRSGECVVTVALPAERVLAPFYRALVGFVLAGLVGMTGVFLFFFVTYRQRMRIRELARLEKFRRDFVADVSHEIKTPLTGILGAADMLSDGENLSKESRTRLLELLKDSVSRLNALVQGILSLACLEREEDILERQETDLREVVREAGEAVRSQAEKKGIALSFQMGKAVVRMVDARLMTQAVTNLLVNAIAYSESPDIIVSLNLEAGRVRLVVEDHGIGLSPEHRSRVFERFYRVDQSRTASTGGSGLGLAIVRQIARLHDGQVRFEPVNPSGSRFIIEL